MVGLRLPGHPDMSGVRVRTCLAGKGDKQTGHEGVKRIGAYPECPGLSTPDVEIFSGRQRVEDDPGVLVPVGLIVLAKGGQRFRCIRIEAKEREGKTSLTVAVYQTKCRGCQSLMEVTGWARVVHPTNFTKVCPDCRKGDPR